MMEVIEAMDSMGVVPKCVLKQISADRDRQS